IALAQEADPRVARPLVVWADRDEGQVGVHEAVQVAAGPPGFLADPLHALRVALGVNDVRDPPVALTGGPHERRVGAPADPDRRAWLLHRLGVDADLLEIGEPAVERGRRVAPECADNVDRLGDARASLAVRYAAELELLRVLAADADAEDQAAAGQHIEGGGRLRRDRRRAQRQERDRGAELDAVGDADVGRQEGEGFVDRIVKRDVIAGPDGLVAPRLEALHEAEVLGGRAQRRRRGRGAAADRGDDRPPGAGWTVPAARIARPPTRG